MSQKKVINYVLDTNVLIQNPDCLIDDSFRGIINIPELVITELEKFKKEDNARGNAARVVGRLLRKLSKQGDISKGIDVGCNTVKIIGKLGNGDELLDGWDPHDPDHKILKTAIQLQKSGTENVIFVTNDVYLATKAERCGLKTQDLMQEKDEYTGQQTVFCQKGSFEYISAGKSTNKDWSLSPENFYVLDEYQRQVAPALVVNQFLTIKNEANHKAIKLGRFDGHSVVALQHENQTVFGIKARNRTQQFLMEALITEEGEERLVIIEGPAGTAKTLFALAVGIEAKQNGFFRKFYVTRSNVEADESFGYLPGAMNVKFDGFLNPIYDNLEVLVDIDKETRKKDCKEITDKNLLLEQLQIEAKPLNYMRGRSLRKSLIFVDEAQNLTRAQVKMIVTRAGEGSVVVLCGDTEQIDGRHLNKFNNGLTHALRSMKGEKICHILRLGTADAERSELSKIAASKL